MPGPGDSNSLRVGPPDLLSTTQGREDRPEPRRADSWPSVKTMRARSSWTSTTRSRRSVSGPQADVRYIAISPDGRWAATGSHNSRDGVKVWSLPDGRFEKQFPNAGMYATPLFSPDGRWLATNLGNELRLWTVGDWREGPRLEGGALAFSPDGRLLAIAQPAGSVRLVEAETGRLVASLDDPQQSRSRQATFSADGSRLILAGEDSRAAHVWDLRAIRHGLVAMGLDWDWPPLPEPDVTTPSRGPAPRRDRSRRARLLLGRIRAAGARSFERGPRDRPRRPVRPGPPRPDFTHHGPLRSSHRRLYAGPRDPAGRSQNPRERGEAYLSEKQYAPGFADCEASLAADPDQASLQNRLAWAYVTAPVPHS